MNVVIMPEDEYNKQVCRAECDDKKREICFRLLEGELPIRETMQQCGTIAEVKRRAQVLTEYETGHVMATWKKSECPVCDEIIKKFQEATK